MKKLFPLLLVLSLICLSLYGCGTGKEYDSTLDSATNEMVGEAELGDITSSKLENGNENGSKIIRTLNVFGETKAFDNAIADIEAKISENGGYIEKSEINGGESLSNNRRTSKQASFVVRIPADKLDSFFEQAKGILNVTKKTETSSNVTLEYYDTKSRLETLQTKKAALDEMLTKAENLDDLLKIQNSLYEVIADIEAYQSKLNLYDNKVNYSTVNLNIEEVIEYTETEEVGFGKRLVSAFTESWVDFGDFCLDFIVFFVAAFPTLLVLGGIVALIIFLVKRSKKSKINKQ